MKNFLKYLSFRKNLKTLKREIIKETNSEFKQHKGSRNNLNLDWFPHSTKTRKTLTKVIHDFYASFVFKSKIKFSFFRNNKFKIFVNFFLLFISSILFFIVFTIPSILGSYSYSIFHNLYPYVSQIKYATNPPNSMHVNQINSSTSSEEWIHNTDLLHPENPCYNSKDPNCTGMDTTKPWLDNVLGSKKLTTPVYGTFNPYSVSHRFQKYIPLGISYDASDLTIIGTYLGGTAINNEWIQGVKSFFKQSPETSALVCQVVGESGTDAGKCVLDAISKEIPYYIRDRIVNPQGGLNNKFSLLFGRIPYDPSVSELFTYLDGRIKKEGDQSSSQGASIQVWGLPESTRLNFLKPYNIKPLNYYNPNWDVVVNKAAAKLLGIGFTQKYSKYIFTPQIPVVINNNENSRPVNSSFFHLNNLASSSKKEKDFSYYKMCVKNASGVSDCISTNHRAVINNGYFQYGWGYDNPSEDRNSNNSVATLVRNKTMSNSFLHNPKPITINIKGVINQPGQPIIYTSQKSVNYAMLYQGNSSNPEVDQQLSDPGPNIWKVYGDQYFNGKLSSLSDPLDLTNFSIANIYGDYSQPTLTGGAFHAWLWDRASKSNIPYLTYYTNSIKSVITSIFTPLIFKQTIVRLIISLFFLFFTLGLVVFIISSIIMSSTSNMAILYGRKTIIMMKLMGYSNIEVSRLSTGFLFWVFIASFISAMIVYFLAIYFILNTIFSITNFLIPITFILWIVPITFIVMLSIYGITKWLSFRSILKLSSQEIFTT